MHMRSVFMRNSGIVIFLAGVVLASLAVRSEAAVTLPPMFSDHMVLQRDVAAPVGASRLRAKK